MDTLTLLGLIAASLTTVSFVPQVLKIWKTKSAGDLSFAMFGTFCVGVVLWLVYGLMLRNLPIIVSNLVTLLLCMAALALMFRYRQHNFGGAGR